MVKFVPEYLIVIIASTVIGWGGFTFRRAEHAVSLAQEAQDASDKLALKLAESYLTKAEFNVQVDRLMVGLDRLDVKLDNISNNNAVQYKLYRERLDLDRS